MLCGSNHVSSFNIGWCPTFFVNFMPEYVYMLDWFTTILIPVKRALLLKIFRFYWLLSRIRVSRICCLATCNTETSLLLSEYHPGFNFPVIRSMTPAATMSDLVASSAGAVIFFIQTVSVVVS